MTITKTQRLDVTQWSDDLDTPINRVQMTADFAKIEALAAVALSGTLADRPAAGVRERLYLVSSGTGAGEVFWDTGAAWVRVTTPKTLRQVLTFSKPGELLVPVGAENVIPGYFSPSPAGQAVRLVGARARIREGVSFTCELRVDGVAVPGMTGMVVTPTATTFTPTLTGGLGPLVPADGFVELVATGVSGGPQNLSFSVYVDVTV